MKLLRNSCRRTLLSACLQLSAEGAPSESEGAQSLPRPLRQGRFPRSRAPVSRILSPPPAASTCTFSRATTRSPRATSSPDQRAARPLVDGTVARGDERADTYFYTGKIGNNSGRIHAVPCDQRSHGPWPRALQRLLLALPFPPRRRQRLYPVRAASKRNRRPITSSAWKKPR